MFRFFLPFATLLLVGLATGCVKKLPPVAMPDATPPTVQGPPPVVGQGRLIVDVANGPTQVEHVTMVANERTKSDGRQTYWFTESYEVLCPASPCVLDMPPGNVLLAFPLVGGGDRIDTELVHVSPGTTVYRRALGEWDDGLVGLRVVSILATLLGVAAAITGIVLLPSGLSNGDDDTALAGGIVLGSGVLLTTLGILGINVAAPTFRPGAAVHFPLPQ